MPDHLEYEHRFPIGPQLWQVCNICNLGGHTCAACGDDISHADARGITPDDRIHWCYSAEGMRSFGITKEVITMP